MKSTENVKIKASWVCVCVCVRRCVECCHLIGCSSTAVSVLSQRLRAGWKHSVQLFICCSPASLLCTDSRSVIFYWIVWTCSEELNHNLDVFLVSFQDVQTPDIRRSHRASEKPSLQTVSRCQLQAPALIRAPSRLAEQDLLRSPLIGRQAGDVVLLPDYRCCADVRLDVVKC